MIRATWPCVCFVLAALAVFAGSSCGASAAPARLSIEQPSISVVEKQFLEMPMAARWGTGPLFWLHGDESKERLETYVQKVAEGHNGSFCAESRPHNDWLGPGWYRDLDICLEAAKQNGLRMWIFDEQWWPSQMVAGKVPPEYGSKVLEATAKTVDGPARFTDDGYSGGSFVAAIAGKEVEGGIEPDSLVDLAPNIQGGKLDWEAPAGKWKVMSFTWRLDERRPVLVDGASRDCVDWFIKTVYQPHYDHFPNDFGKTILGYFYDEPETRGDWGTELGGIFAERKIDPKKALVAYKFGLAGEEQTAARYAYIDAFSEAWGRTMYGGMTRWCNEHNVLSIGHFLEHEGLYLSPEVCAFDMFDQQKYSDMGAMDLVVQQLYPGQRNPGIYQIPKLASSISHAYHKADDLTMCEIFGAYGQDITYPEMKWLADHHQVRGVNFMIPHSINPRAPKDTDCPPYFYMDEFEPRWPLYRVWSDYSNRLSLLLSGGRHACPVALLFCGNSAHVGRAVTPEDMTTALQDVQFDCDWIPYEVFEVNGRIAGREIRIHDERYKVLIVPPVEVIPYETLGKARAFFDSGGIVIGYGFLPSKSATFGHTSRDIAALCEAIWGRGEPGGGVCKRSAAGGRSYFLGEKPTSEELWRALVADAGVHPAMEVLAGDTGGWLHVLHRVKCGRDVFLVCNQNHQGGARRFRFRATAEGEPECWDAMRNEINALPYKRINRRTVEFELTMEPSESALIVFQARKVKRPIRIEPGQAPERTVPLARQIVPTEKISRNPAESAAELILEGCSWVWYPEGKPEQGVPPGTRYFRKALDLPAGRKVEEGKLLMTADNGFVLYVNGEEAGSGGDWWSPVEVDLTRYLAEGRNIIAVAATNDPGPGPNPAGLMAVLRIRFSDGGTMITRSDRTWKSSDTEQAGWTAASFDDSAWREAKEISEFGQGPWGTLTAGVTISPITADPYIGSCTLPAGFEAKGWRVYVEMEGLPDASASVKVNGADAGGVIGAPCRVNVTSHLKAGRNVVEVVPLAPERAYLAFYGTEAR